MEPGHWIAIVAAMGLFYPELRNLIFRDRTREAMKVDLEILNLIKVKDKNYKIVKEKIDRSVAEFYTPKISFNWSELARFLFIIVLFYFAPSIFRSGVSAGMIGNPNAIWTVDLAAPIFIVVSIWQIIKLILKLPK